MVSACSCLVPAGFEFLAWLPSVDWYSGYVSWINLSSPGWFWLLCFITAILTLAIVECLGYVLSLQVNRLKNRQAIFQSSSCPFIRGVLGVGFSTSLCWGGGGACTFHSTQRGHFGFLPFRSQILVTGCFTHQVISQSSLHFCEGKLYLVLLYLLNICISSVMNVYSNLLPIFRLGCLI